MMKAHTGMETVEFRSPDGKKEVVVFAGQVFAVTRIADGTTTLIGPQNAAMFVEGSVKDARDKIVAALKHAANKPEGD